VQTSSSNDLNAGSRGLSWVTASLFGVIDSLSHADFLKVVHS
jgi:hypothetical protein